MGNSLIIRIKSRVSRDFKVRYNTVKQIRNTSTYNMKFSPLARIFPIMPIADIVMVDLQYQ